MEKMLKMRDAMLRQKDKELKAREMKLKKLYCEFKKLQKHKKFMSTIKFPNDQIWRTNKQVRDKYKNKTWHGRI